MQVKLLHRGKRLQRSSKCQLSECRRWKVWRLQRTELLRIFSPNALALQLQLPARQVRSARWFKCLKSQPVDLTKGHIVPHCFTHFWSGETPITSAVDTERLASWLKRWKGALARLELVWLMVLALGVFQRNQRMRCVPHTKSSFDCTTSESFWIHRLADPILGLDSQHGLETQQRLQKKMNSLEFGADHGPWGAATVSFMSM